MPVLIHGTSYATVAERLALAHGEKAQPQGGIKSIVTEPVQVGQLVIFKATITFMDGRVFTGSSLVNLNASGPAERDAPAETAETSSVGRALAMAGWPGSDQGLAGAEEIHLAQRRAEARPAARYGDGSTDTTRVERTLTPSGRLAQSGGSPTPKQMEYVTRLLKERGEPPPDDLTAMSARDVSALIDRLRGA